MTSPAVRNLRRRGGHAPAAMLDPLAVADIYLGEQKTPDVMEWVLSDAYLDQPGIYPRQGTFLKLAFLQPELLTQFDYDVIGEWGETFSKTGTEGIQPDVLERVRICKEQGRPWFHEIIAVIGRRGSKGYLGALSGSYVLWHYMHRPGGPQAYYGIERSKKLVSVTFAGKRQQAKENQWRDLTAIITGAPCFEPYISRPLAEILTVFAPSDILRAHRQMMRGVESDLDPATFEIVPRESSLMAARGPAAFMLHFDEMAHVVATGVNRSAEEVYNSATPALDQFGVDAFIYAGSSPWQMAGRYYEMWLESIEKNADGSPAYPEKLMLQLPSWGLYDDWEHASEIITRPPVRVMVYIEHEISVHERVRVPVEISEPAPKFSAKRGAIQSYDAPMRQLERSNPDNFAVERLSRWAPVLDAYLDEKKVAEIFGPFGGALLRVKERGMLSTDYVAHGDPGLVNDRFGYALGHVEIVEEPRVSLPDTGGPAGQVRTDLVKHVVFDVIDYWDPIDYDEHRIDYIQVGEEICAYIDAFMPQIQTFDQYNSAEGIQRIMRHVAEVRRPKRTDVYEETATEKSNWVKAEIFKSAINLGRVHAPALSLAGSQHDPSELAELELRFLQRKGKRVDHPSAGPVQSKDVADCLVSVVWHLIGKDLAEEIGMDLMGLKLGASMGGGGDPYGGMASREPAKADIGEVAGMFQRATGGAAAGGYSSPARGGRVPRR